MAAGARRKAAGRSRGGDTSKRTAQGKESLLLDREALRHWRLQRGLTQQSLAQQRVKLDGELVQLSYAQLRRIEKDGRAGPASARILAALLGVELAQLRPRDPTQLPCGLPRDVSVDFVGRTAQLDAVLGILQREGNARIAASVEGLPGIGKTELALQVCALCERTRAYRIFWLDAAQPDLTPIWAESVARHLGIEHPEQRERARLALHAIEALGQPTLLVLDNVERWSASEPWPRPQGRHIRWLVTTRASRLGERAFEHVEVPALGEESSAELLARIAGLEVTGRPGFRELVQHLAGYTIAVELAGAFLARFPEVEPTEYLEALRAGKADVLEGEVAHRTLYQDTLESALELLWRRIPAATRASWQLAACFAQDGASAELSDRCGLARRSRAELRDYHLIQSEGQSWNMHRLVRAFARRHTPPAVLEQARGSLVRGCAARLERAAESLVAVYLQDRAHAELALELGAELPDAQEPLAELRRSIGEAREQMGSPLSSQALLLQAVQFYEEQAQAASQPPHGLAYARARFKLGRALLSQNRLNSSREALNNAVKVCREAVVALEPERSQFPLEWADAQRLLGLSLWRLAKGSSSGFDATAGFTGAAGAYRAALQIYTQAEHPEEWARTQCMLGTALVGLGRRSGELEPLREAADVYRAARAAKPMHAKPQSWIQDEQSLVLAEVLGDLCERSGDREAGEEAIALCRAVLEQRTRAQVPLLWAHVQYTLGQVHCSLGMSTGSGEHYAAAVEALQAALDGCDRQAAWFPWTSTAHALASALKGMADALGDRAAIDRALELYPAVLEEVTAERDATWRAALQCQFGSALAKRAKQSGDEAEAERAVALCREALSLLARERDEMAWSSCQNELGVALAVLARLRGEAALAREAQQCWRSAQSVMDAERFSRDHAQLQAQIEELEPLASGV